MSTEGDTRKYFLVSVLKALKILEASFAKVALEPSNQMLESSGLRREGDSEGSQRNNFAAT